jgi:hypothetical protein
MVVVSFTQSNVGADSLLETAAMHQIVKGGTAHAEELGRLAVIAVDATEHTQDRILFGFFAHAAQV